jgi:hypothetical protein
MDEKNETHADLPANDIKSSATSAEEDYVVPGAPIVRASTPRPLPFNLLSAKTELPLLPSAPSAAFPTEVPIAPPLPEEEGACTGGGSMPSSRQEAPQIPRPNPELAPRPLASEFIWLFEYALDMDPVYLNRPERLDGSAFAYGPAVLNGYRLVFDGLDIRTGQVVASLLATPGQPEAQVWGILYRIPRRFKQGINGAIPLLDKVHLAETFVPVEVQVREAYRQREITCITYVASEATRQQVHQLSSARCVPEPSYLRRLLQISRRQKLPASYLQTLEELLPPNVPTTAPPITPPEQNTDPLPLLASVRELHTREVEPWGVKAPSMKTRRGESSESNTRPFPWKTPYPSHIERWLMVFALYLSLLLLGTLTLAIFQGLGLWSQVFTASFAPLGIPWYVLLYGLLGGCISCIILLNRPCSSYPPTFVLLTWFMRPFLGAVLGAFAYLLLNSGIILISAQSGQRFILGSLVGLLAGLFEGWLLLRKGAQTP